MKAILEFDLNTERYEFEAMKNGLDYKAVIEEILELLRSKVKYEDEDMISIEDLRDRILEAVKDRDLSIF